MLVENQMIEVRWSNRIKKYYINKGYSFTQNGNKFYAKAEDLPHNSSKYKFEVECDYCGKRQYIKPQDYYKNTKDSSIKYSCNNCKFKKDKEYRKDKEEYFNLFLKKCKENNCIPISTIHDYENAYSKLKYICPFHGIQETSYVIMYTGSWCKECANLKMSEQKRMSPDFLKYIIENKNNNKLLNTNSYINAHTKNLVVKCGSCGNIFITSLCNYKAKEDGKCPNCSERSYGEFLTAMYLDKYGVTYFRQEHFNGDCRDIRPLPFDFYLPEYNICIEYDGEQHFEPIFGMDVFLSTILHDGMKNNYCKWNNIRLIRIPYWDRDNIEQILIKELNLAQQEKQTA